MKAGPPGLWMKEIAALGFIAPWMIFLDAADALVAIGAPLLPPLTRLGPQRKTVTTIVVSRITAVIGIVVVVPRVTAIVHWTRYAHRDAALPLPLFFLFFFS